MPSAGSIGERQADQLNCVHTQFAVRVSSPSLFDDEKPGAIERRAAGEHQATR